MEAFYYTLIASVSLILYHNGEAMMGPPPNYQPLIQAYDIADGQCSGITSSTPGTIKTTASETCRQAFLMLDQAGMNVCHGGSEAKCRRLAGHSRYECTVKMPRCWANLSPRPRTLLECAESNLFNLLNRRRPRRDDGASGSGYAGASGSGYTGASGLGYTGAGGSGYTGAGGSGYTGAGGSGYTGAGGSGYTSAGGSGYFGAGGSGYFGAGGSGYFGASGSGRTSPQHASPPPSPRNPPSQYFPSYHYPSPQPASPPPSHQYPPSPYFPSYENPFPQQYQSSGQGAYSPSSSNLQYPTAPEYSRWAGSFFDFSLPSTHQEPGLADSNLVRDENFSVADVPYGTPPSPPEPDICVDDIPYDSPIFVGDDPAHAEDDEAVEGGQYECDRPGCTKAYDTDKKLRKHIRHHEVIEEGRTICSECQRRFCSKQALKRHLSSTEHLQNVRRKGKGSSSQAGDPDADDEAVEGGQYECDRPGCTKAYDTDKKLRKHIRQHEVIEEGKTICPKCQRRFSSRANLRRHQESTGHFQAPSPPREPKKFQCPECDRSYDRKSTLKEHLKSHEGKADCPYCPESFGRPATMYNHVSKKHPDKPNPRDPRKSN